MRNRTYLNRTLILCCLLVGLSTICAADEAKKEHTWTFHGENGTAKIKASQFERDSDHKPFIALDLWVEDGKSNIEEEGRFFSSVLDDLPKAGFELSTLSHLEFRLEQTDASQRIAVLAATTPNWYSISRSGRPATIYPVAASMLNKSGAFREWVEAFHAHGIDAEIAGVEKLGMMRFQQIGIPCPAKVNCSHVLVPDTALVQINFYPIGQK